MCIGSKRTELIPKG